jgi:hypothetical protein
MASHHTTNINVPPETPSIPQPNELDAPFQLESVAKSEENGFSRQSLQVEPYSFENIVNFRDVGASCTVKCGDDIKRYLLVFYVKTVEKNKLTHPLSYIDISRKASCFDQGD